MHPESQPTSAKYVAVALVHAAEVLPACWHCEAAFRTSADTLPAGAVVVAQSCSSGTPSTPFVAQPAPHMAALTCAQSGEACAALQAAERWSHERAERACRRTCGARRRYGAWQKRKCGAVGAQRGGAAGGCIRAGLCTAQPTSHLSRAQRRGERGGAGDFRARTPDASVCKRILAGGCADAPRGAGTEAGEQSCCAVECSQLLARIAGLVVK